MLKYAGHIWSCGRPLLLSILPVLMAASACTFGVPIEPLPLPEFGSVAIMSEGPTDELKARFGVTADNSSTGVGVAAGAGVGSLAAVGVSLACGPFALLCALATVPTGAMVGGIGGGAVGAAVDTQKKPPEEQLLILDNLFVELSEQRTIHLEIRDKLEQQFPPDRLADKTSADALLKLSLSDVRFTISADDEYTLTMKANLRAQWNRSMRRVRNDHRIYKSASRTLPLDDWLYDDGETLNMAFDACVDELVEQMADDIHFR